MTKWSLLPLVLSLCSCAFNDFASKVEERRAVAALEEIYGQLEPLKVAPDRWFDREHAPSSFVETLREQGLIGEGARIMRIQLVSQDQSNSDASVTTTLYDTLEHVHEAVWYPPSTSGSINGQKVYLQPTSVTCQGTRRAAYVFDFTLREKRLPYLRVWVSE